MNKKKKAAIIVLATALALLLAVFGVVPLLQWLLTNRAEDLLYENIVEEYISFETPLDTSEPEEIGYVVDFDGLLAQNPDFIGWLSSPDTPIFYPVVHTTDSQKYLRRSFAGEYSESGTLFVYGEVDFITPSQNICIYGHNMGRGRDVMFSSLLEYKNQEYYASHGTFRFDTLYRTGEYKVFAAFNTMVTDGFIYMQTDFADELEYLEFISHAMSLTPYDTGQPLRLDSEILTLSTCDRAYGGQDGRYVVMAVKVGD